MNWTMGLLTVAKSKKSIIFWQQDIRTKILRPSCQFKKEFSSRKETETQPMIKGLKVARTCNFDCLTSFLSAQFCHATFAVCSDSQSNKLTVGARCTPPLSQRVKIEAFCPTGGHMRQRKSRYLLPPGSSHAAVFFSLKPYKAQHFLCRSPAMLIDFRFSVHARH